MRRHPLPLRSTATTLLVSTAALLVVVVVTLDDPFGTDPALAAASSAAPRGSSHPVVVADPLLPTPAPVVLGPPLPVTTAAPAAERPAARSKRARTPARRVSALSTVPPAVPPAPYDVTAPPLVIQPSPTLAPPVLPAAAAPVTFRIGTLNILGSQHSPGGPARAAALAGAIVDRAVDVVGLQEVQSDQLSVLESQLAGYAVWPSRALGNQGLRLQIAYRASRFDLVDAGWITTTFDHQERPVPWVQLVDRASGRTFHVVDVHNSPGTQAADRWSATTEEIALLQQLGAGGGAVFVVGDTNEPTATACRIATATGLVGSDGLSAANGCRVTVGPVKIDHVLGGGGVRFSGHVVDLDAPVRASTDHSFVHTTATLLSSPLPSS